MVEIKLYDVVVLKTRGVNDPKMVVMALPVSKPTGRRQYVTCEWFNTLGNARQWNFPIETVVKVGD